MTEQNIRVPNLPIDKMVDADGYATPSEMTFRQSLVTGLQRNFGEEGVVPPSQDTQSINKIQNNITIDPSTNTPLYTAKGGTLIYDETTNELKVCILGGASPIFKVIATL